MRSPESDEYYTPQQVIVHARQVLRRIDLDPASCATAQKVVRATKYYTKRENGLKQDWHGRLWLNPPYSNPAPWTMKLIESIERGDVTNAIVLLNASSDTRWFHELAERYWICLTRGRINFSTKGGATSGNRVGQAFFYHGSAPGRFKLVFRRYGLVGHLHL